MDAGDVIRWLFYFFVACLLAALRRVLPKPRREALAALLADPAADERVTIRLLCARDEAAELLRLMDDDC